MISVRAAEPGIALNTLLLAEQAVRAGAAKMRKAIPYAILPDRVHLQGPREGRPDGKVEVQYAEGSVIGVGEPTLAASGDLERMTWFAVHELAHYHELRTREKLRLVIRPRRAFEAWSEYYAQRTAVSLGGTSFRFVAPSNGRRAKGPARSQRGKGSYGAFRNWYTAIWLIAERDELGPNAKYPPQKAKVLQTLLPLIRTVADSLDEYYRLFPNWSQDEANAAGSELMQTLRLANRLGRSLERSG